MNKVQRTRLTLASLAPARLRPESQQLAAELGRWAPLAPCTGSSKINRVRANA
jgi:hypothetical protein